MEAATETPAAAPEPVANAASPPAATGDAGELSLDQIIAAGLTEAAAAPEPAPASTETVVTAATDDTPTPVQKPPETPAEEAPPADDVSAARARRILSDVEKREQALVAREASMEADIIARLLIAPKATLAKHGKHIDDIIDSSLAEGAPAAAEPEEDRLTKLEKRVEAREQAEKQARHDALVANRKAEIHRDVLAAAAKFPVLAEVKRPDLVTDFMAGYYEAHGKPCTWEFAAGKLEADLTGTGIAAAKKLGWAPPAKAAAPAPAAERTGTVSIGGAQAEGVTPTSTLPEDPEQLLKHLVAINGG